MATGCEAVSSNGGGRDSCPNSPGFLVLSKKLGSLEYTGSNQLVGITWDIFFFSGTFFFYRAVLSLAKSPRSDRDVCVEGGIEDTVPSHP